MGYIREVPLKKGGRRYQAEVRLKGHPTQTATFDRKTDAKAWVYKVEADIRCGRNQLYTESKRRTFSEAIQRYCREQIVSVVKRGHLHWWDKELGSLYLQDVRPAMISEKKQKLLSESTAKGIIRGKSTCNRYLASLSHLMSTCVKQWEWISENPVKKIAREKEPRERTRFLKPEERQRFLEVCKFSHNKHLFLFVVLLLATGGRYNEIRNLKWPEVDLLNGRITIVKSKNSLMRSIPVRGFALDLLRMEAQKTSSLGYLFPSEDKSRPLELRRAYRTAIQRAGLKAFRGHDCRHSYATEMLAQGLSLGEIGHLLGHLNVATTRKYAHLVESRSADAVAKMSNQIFQGVSDEQSS
jgi:integrase